MTNLIANVFSETPLSCFSFHILVNISYKTLSVNIPLTVLSELRDSLKHLLLMTVKRTVSGIFTDTVLYDMLTKLRKEKHDKGVSLKTLLAISLVNLLLLLCIVLQVSALKKIVG